MELKLELELESSIVRSLQRKKSPHSPFLTLSSLSLYLFIIQKSECCCGKQNLTWLSLIRT